MPQIFHPSFNTIAKVSILAGLLGTGALGWVGYAMEKSPYHTKAGIPVDQPVPFSHEHHVKGLGLDCRYCHTSVETSYFAGLPPTKTCMTCHSQIWSNAEMLRPVRQSWESGQPLQWNRVHNLPAFVYFNHSIHVAKGIGCTSCHGQVDRMPLTWQAATLQMSWCLTCHREPEQFIRPREEVFNMNYQYPSNQAEVGRKLVEAYHVRKDQLTNCSICHR